MRIILRTMDLPGKSAALYRPRKSPIELVSEIHMACLGTYLQLVEHSPVSLSINIWTSNSSVQLVAWDTVLLSVDDGAT